MRRALFGALCAVALTAELAQSAAADRGPTPSAEQVTAAQIAEADAAAQARTLDAQLEAARSAVTEARAAAAESSRFRPPRQTLLRRADVRRRHGDLAVDGGAT